MSVLKFEAFTSFVEPEFWHRLYTKKAEIGLGGSPLQIKGRIHASRSADGVPLALFVGGNAFDVGVLAEGEIVGELLITNSLSEFELAVKEPKVLNEAGARFYKLITSDPQVLFRNLCGLQSFTFLCFAALKEFKFHYQFAFPVLLPPKEQGSFLVVGSESLPQKLEFNLGGYFAQLYDPITGLTVPLNESDLMANRMWHVLHDYTSPGDDDQTVVSWTARNYLLWVKYLLAQTLEPIVKVVFWRGSAAKSILVHVALDPEHPLDRSVTPQVTGWERSWEGRLQPKLADLAESMDPAKLAELGASLNLKLMRWRMTPELDLPRVGGQKCLLLGMGTLGSYISRLLTAWGVREMTLVDNGVVSFSNPVRQPLYRYKDAALSFRGDARVYKANAAAEALRESVPTLRLHPRVFNIPMPGHPCAPDTYMREILELEDMVCENDVIFLLLDSREARYFPTLLSAVHQKLVINVALGADSFVVMHHGLPGFSQVDYGCYYCSDVVGPTNSSFNKTLDQQCTVTRPGVAPIASGYAVELFASIACTDFEKIVSLESPLGSIPHQIRGTISDHQLHRVKANKSEFCTACSFPIIERFLANKKGFVHDALHHPHSLEILSGLAQFKEMTDVKLSALKLQDDDEKVEEGEWSL